MHENTTLPDTGCRLSVLVVEDQLLIAMEIEMILEENGYHVIGPATSVQAALRLLQVETPDVAVLDVNLVEQLVTPVAARLRSLHIPFVLSSAYPSLDLDESDALAGAENVGKPIDERKLLGGLARAIAGN